MIKKVISAALSLVFLLGITAIAVPSDVVGTPYQRAVDLTTSLGIIDVEDADTFNPEGSLTRGEFVKNIIKMLGVTDVSGSGSESLFSDVSSGDSLSGYINTAYYMGIVNGYTDGTFGANDPVKLEQAVKILVSALGRDIESKAKGGYPAGYYAVASQIGLLKSINAGSGVEINRGQGAILIYNALSVDLMDQLSYGGENKYVTINGKTVLTERLEIEKGSGKVSANNVTRLSSPITNVQIDEVEIGNVVFKVGTTNAAGYLGYNVDYYYKEEAGVRTLLAVVPQRNTGAEIVVEAENILRLNESNVLEFFRNKDDRGPAQKARISLSADWIFNGRAMVSGYSKYLNENRIPNGSVRLLDTDNDKIYDLVFIDTYVNYVVSAKSDSDFIISDKYGHPSIKLDDSENNRDIFYSIVSAEGEEMSFEEIEEGNVLTIAADTFVQKSSGNYVYNEIDTNESILYKIIVSTESVDGVINEINSDGDVMVDDVYYEISDGYLRAVNQAFPDAPQLVLGTEGEFLLDAFGRIAAADVEVIPGEEYGFLLQMGETGGIEGRVEFKVLTTDNEMEIFKSAKRVKINSVPVLQENLLTSGVSGDIYQNGAAVKQLIRYTLNDEDELEEIYTAADHTGDDTYIGYDLTRFSKDLAVYENDASYPDRGYVRHDKSSIATKFSFTKATPLLIVPTFDGVQDEDYIFDTVDYLRNDTRYNLNLYDVNEEYRASILELELAPTIREVISSAIQTSAVGIVERVASVINEEGVDTYKVYYTGNGQAGQEVEAVDEDVSNNETSSVAGVNWNTPQITVGQLRKGDVIQITKNGYGEMKFFRLLFRAHSSNALPMYYERANHYSQVGAEKPNYFVTTTKSIYVGYGKIESVKSGAFIFNVRNQDNYAEGKETANRDMYLKFGSTKVYEYNRRTDTISIIEPDSVTAGQEAFIRLNGLNVRDLIIIKN